MQRLSKAAVAIWRTQCTAVFAVVCFICGVFAAFFWWVSLCAAAVVFVSYFYVVAKYCPKKHETQKYGVSGEVLLLENGVRARKFSKSFMPSIQYVKLSESPLQRGFKVCTVHFCVAGARVKIPHISHEMAQTLEKFAGCEK